MTLEASITDFAAGPESFLIYNLGANPVTFIPEPATYALLLAGLGAVVLGGMRRKSS